jgi:hypothetical protein
MDVEVADALRVSQFNWAALPRVAACLAVRSVRRAAPLAYSFDPLRASAIALVALGHGFACDSGALPADAEAFARELTQRLRSATTSVMPNERSTATMKAMVNLSMCLEHATLGVQMQNYAPRGREWSDAFASAAALAIDARGEADKAVKLAAESRPEPDNVARVQAALSADETLLQMLREHEINRLGNPAVDPRVFDPSADPSEGGPFGLLWPAGPASWYAEEGEKGPVVLSRAAYSFPYGTRPHADIVAYCPSGVDADALIDDGLRFVTETLGSRQPPPIPCVYLPDRMRTQDRQRALGMLTVKGATVMGERELGRLAPRLGLGTDDMFAQAVHAAHQGIADRWEQDRRAATVGECFQDAAGLPAPSTSVNSARLGTSSSGASSLGFGAADPHAPLSAADGGADWVAVVRGVSPLIDRPTRRAGWPIAG